MLQGIPTASYDDPTANTLCHFIEFGESYKAPPEETDKGPASESFTKKNGRTVAITTEDMQKRRNDVKARTTLLLALPDEHHGKGKVYTASVPTASIQVFTASTDVAAASLSHDTIDEDDIEEMDIKWNMDLLSMRADRFWKKTGKKITIQGSNVAGFDKSKVECFNCHKIGHFSRECRAPRSQDRGKRESYKQGLPKFVDDTVTDYSRPTPSIDASKCNKSELQSSNFFAFEHGESSDSIMSKPMIKFVKEADCPRVIKTNNTKNARKSTVKYDEMYRNISNGPKGNPQNNIDDKGYWDSGCSRYMTGNISYLSDYEPYDEGYVSFGHGGGKITGKGIIKIDETSSILRNFITEIEKLKGLKVKINRCDNGGEFKNKEMNEFCTKKGIIREFSNAKTPQQNRVAEKRNRTLIEAARTILADAKLLVTFWTEAVNTAYSLSSKAFRVFNKRTKKVEENLLVDFLENKLIEKGASLNWLFDIDTLTNSMNYVPVVIAGTSSTNILGTKDVTSQVVKKDVSFLRYIALPNCGISNPTATLKVPSTDQVETAVSLTMEYDIFTVGSPVPTVCLDISPDSSSGPRLISKEDSS
nr:putative ribonuclease H-like domain-containing protein [Tanacetum cinerariifolium]